MSHIDSSLLFTDYDDIKRTTNRFELGYLSKLEEYYEQIDIIFDKVEKQIFEQFNLGSDYFIEYSDLYNNEYIIQNYPEVLSYYKDKLYSLINIKLSQYIDGLTINNNTDSEYLEKSSIFHYWYNTIFGIMYNTFKLDVHDSIVKLYEINDIESIKELFKNYYKTIIDEQLYNLKNLLEIKQEILNQDSVTDIKTKTLIRNYLLMKNIDIDKLEQLYNRLKENNLDNQLRAEFIKWIDDIINNLKITIDRISYTRDICIASLNNPETSNNFLSLIVKL